MLSRIIQELTTNAFELGEVRHQEKERHLVAVIRVSDNMEKFQHGFKVVRHRKTLFMERGGL
jgi:hypothetical protein